MLPEFFSPRVGGFGNAISVEDESVAGAEFLLVHGAIPARAGLAMRPTKLVIFGNPKGGTPAMQAAPTVAIDLLLKALIWEDAEGDVWVTYNDPEYLRLRHDVPAEAMTAIAGIKNLLQALVSEEQKSRPAGT